MDTPAVDMLQTVPYNNDIRQQDLKPAAISYGSLPGDKGASAAGYPCCRHLTILQKGFVN
ncbi:MAG: hypothetical protein AVO34_09920 [Firmicutes bacterium ML8_F2]|nr:MAG: hypothetical protein AVO34_09920 [Firmicutes bacterium ML8_F2]